MTKKLDFLGECNDQGIPLEDFRLAFCVRCFQKDCTRSQHGTSKFENRVNHWEERLFHPPQLPRNDPRYATIAAKRFLTLSSGPAPAVRDWIDPQAPSLDTPPPVIQAPPASEKPAVQPEPVSVQPAPPVEIKVPEPEPVPVQAVETKPEIQPRKNLFVNTPYSGGRTLEKPATASTSVERPRDPWATPSPVKPGEKVVQPGARVKIGRTP